MLGCHVTFQTNCWLQLPEILLTAAKVVKPPKGNVNHKKFTNKTQLQTSLTECWKIFNSGLLLRCELNVCWLLQHRRKHDFGCGFTWLQKLVFCGNINDICGPRGFVKKTWGLTNCSNQHAVEVSSRLWLLLLTLVAYWAFTTC